MNVRAATAAGATRLWDLAREHPLPALTVGLGLGWLVADAARGGPASSLLGRRRRHDGRSLRAASDALERVPGSARRAGDGLRGLVDERPLAVGAASLAIGLLAGLALPATRREDELLGDARDELLESARDAGREALDRGREAAATAVERVKESVREQELTPEQLVEKARHLTHDAAATLRDAERQMVDSLGGGAGRDVRSAAPGVAPGSGPAGGFL